MEIKYCKLNSLAYNLSTKMTEGSSGFDLVAVEKQNCISGKKIMVRTGIAVEIPKGYEGQIRPRSSMSKNYWSTSFGTIDSDYRGELIVILKNEGTYAKCIKRGDRIAQLVICKTESIVLNEIQPTELSTTERGTGGFGSTGK
jgi:dUTP pyrophosphatase